MDNDVNLLALGRDRAYRSGPRPTDDLLFVKIGTGIGAGLVSGGRLHRGANGCAGDIGHVAVAEADDVVCRCGNVGCLEAVAGGAALARDGGAWRRAGTSPLVAEMLGQSGDDHRRRRHGRRRPGRPGRARRCSPGRAAWSAATLATLVSFYNPGLVVLGGGGGRAGDHVLAAIREAVYRRSLPLATRTLRIEPSVARRGAGLAGAVHLVLDALFAAERLPVWLPYSSPAGRPEVARRRRRRGLTPVDGPDALWRGFCEPPDDARPRAWWHWMDGNVDPEGIRLDLEWLHRVGVRGVQMFDGGMGTPLVVPERVRHGSPAWRERGPAGRRRPRTGSAWSSPSPPRPGGAPPAGPGSSRPTR